MRRWISPIVLCLAAAAVVTGCKARKYYPDVKPGWHSPNYDVVFGRVARMVPKDPADPTIWLIRYGLTTSTDSYGGELALKPADKLAGYTGGELVEIHGQVDPSFASPNYPGRWYNVTSIKLWNGYSRQ